MTAQDLDPSSIDEVVDAAISEFSTALLRNYPGQAARKLEGMEPQAAAAVLAAQTLQVRLPVWLKISPAAASLMLVFF